jgi:hypothetical protein
VHGFALHTLQVAHCVLRVEMTSVARAGVRKQAIWMHACWQERASDTATARIIAAEPLKGAMFVGQFGACQRS